MISEHELPFILPTTNPRLSLSYPMGNGKYRFMHLGANITMTPAHAPSRSIAVILAVENGSELISKYPTMIELALETTKANAISHRE